MQISPNPIVAIAKRHRQCELWRGKRHFQPARAGRDSSGFHLALAIATGTFSAAILAVITLDHRWRYLESSIAVLAFLLSLAGALAKHAFRGCRGHGDRLQLSHGGPVGFVHLCYLVMKSHVLPDTQS